MNSESLKQIINSSLTEEAFKKANSYLAIRKLSNVQRNDHPVFGFIDYFTDENITIVNSLVIFTRDILGDISQIEVRSLNNGEYDKIYTSDMSIPIYNIEELIQHDNIILTESVIEAETINQHVEGVCAISVNSASIKKSQIYMMMLLLKGKNLFIAFNNDTSGIENAKRISRFIKLNFNKESKFIDYPFNDLNLFLTRKGTKYFSRYIQNEIFTK